MTLPYLAGISELSVGRHQGMMPTPPRLGRASKYRLQKGSVLVIFLLHIFVHEVSLILALTCERGLRLQKAAAPRPRGPCPEGMSLAAGVLPRPPGWPACAPGSQRA